MEGLRLVQGVREVLWQGATPGVSGGVKSRAGVGCGGLQCPHSLGCSKLPVALIGTPAASLWACPGAESSFLNRQSAWDVALMLSLLMAQNPTRPFMDCPDNLSLSSLASLLLLLRRQ